MARLADIRADLTAYLAAFDAAVLSGADAEAAVREASAIRNLADTVVAVAAKRVADSMRWKRDGHRRAADWLAGETKSSVGAAAGLLETAERLEACPGVAAKARAGGLSAPQAQALAKAVTADPSSETRLLELAAREDLRTLKDRCRAVELAGDDSEERHARIHRERCVRHWTDDEGAFRLAAKLTADAGAKVLGALAPFEKAAFKTARTDGRHEPHEAYAADALVALAEAALSGTGGGRSRKPAFVALVDARALKRGHAEAGETCEVPGVGPVSVTALREQAGDAIWHVLVTDGEDIRTYASASRHIPTSLRIALTARDRVCVVPGCGSTEGLEIDHIIPVEEHGLTTYENLARPCYHHHRRTKHQQGWTLAGTPGHWTLTPPDTS